VSHKGRAHKYGNNIDTDAIIAARYLNMHEPSELAAHCMEDIDPAFLRRVKPGDIMVAEANFGCGSSREHAPVAIRAAGISCVIGKSFARIFFRNAINTGLPLLECGEAVDNIRQGDEVEADPATGTITNLSSGQTFRSKPYPAFMLEIISAGGLVEHTIKKLGRDG
jgi:3-isopropylmalate/(R)-2-methylmalate dehydratase small subunit